MRLTFIPVLTGMLLAANPAAGNNYFTASYSDLDYQISVADLNVRTIHGTLGTKFNQQFAAELRLGTDVGSVAAHFYGAYIKAHLPLNLPFQPYAVLGYTKAKVADNLVWADEVSIVSGRQSDLSYGLGANFSLNELELNVEYISYIEEQGVDFSGFSIGITKYY